MEEDTTMPPSYTVQQCEPEVSGLIEKVKALLPKDGSSSIDREQLLLTSQKLSVALETPGETGQRLAYLVRAEKNEPSKAIRLTHVFIAYDHSSLPDW